jgi:putative membrane protein
VSRIGFMRSGLRRRLAAAACAAVAVFAASAPPAWAHVGVPRSVVTAGPYRLVISAGPVAAPPRAALAFQAVISERVGGAPVESGRIVIAVSNAAGTILGDFEASGYAGVYSLVLPIPNANHWRSLRFEIAVAGRFGTFTGRYIPPSLLGQWSLEPAVLAAAALGAALFGFGFLRLRRRSRRDHASLGRLVLFAAGLALIVLPLVSPLDVVGDRYLLSAHMLQHVLLGDAGPALVLLSLRGPLLFFALPPSVLRHLGRSARVRRAASWLLRAPVALGAWALAYGGWHVPAAYDYAASHQLAHDFEHASFVLAGFLVWSLLIDPSGHGRLSRGRRLAIAAGVFAMGTVISDVLIFSLHPLYPSYASQVERVFGLSPLRDQQLAGLVMNVEQILTLGTFAAVMLVPTLRRRRRSGKFAPGRESLA